MQDAHEDQGMDLLWLHQQLVQGEDSTEALARLLLPRLRHQMAAAFPTVDPAWVSDAVTDTLLEFFARPDKYDPRRGKPLIAFLAQAAAWKLRDLARSHRRQERYQEQTAELCQEAGPGPDSPPTPPADNAAEPAEPPPEITAWLVGQMEDLKDRKLIRLMLLGVRKTAAYAKVMGCSGTTVEIQRREVKRAKERLSYKLRCLADRWVTEHPQALRLN